MQETQFQVLEVRAGESAVTVTAAVTAEATSAINTALSEQLDRHRLEPLESPGEIAELRQEAGLVERFAELAAAEAHAVVSLSPDELRACLMSLTQYVDRVDGEHYQPADLRERLQVIADAVASMWDANAAAAEAEAAAFSGARH